MEKLAPTDAPARPLEGGDLLVAALAARGVERIFSVSGGPINSIYHATARSPVALCHVRHEGAAGYMADATYRTTGVPGVAVVTLGPGVTNAVTPAATALRASTPLLIVGGQAPVAMRDREAALTIDGVAAMRPVTKWATQVAEVGRIPEYVDEAWRRMTSGRPGPVYLEIPADVIADRAPADAADAAAGAVRFTHPPADPAAVAALRDALARARRPLLIAGDDVFHTGAAAALGEAVERLRLPFAQLRLARGAVDERHPLSLGPGCTPLNPGLRQALAEADCVVLLGHNWDFDLDFGAGVAPTATVVQVHLDAATIGRERPVDLGIVAAARPLLEQLLREAAPPQRDERWIAEAIGAWRRERERVGALARAPRAGAMHPVRLIEEVVAAMPPETLWVTSHGNVDFWADGAIEVPAEGAYLRAGQYGPLGAEVSFGVAAKLAAPQRPVVVFVGDGGFGYHGVELESAARYGAPLIVVVADDQSWGAIALPQRRAYGVEVEMDLPRRDWAAFARAIGGHGEVADRPEEVAGALERCVASGLPSVVHARIASELSPYMDHTSK